MQKYTFARPCPGELGPAGTKRLKALEALGEFGPAHIDSPIFVQLPRSRQPVSPLITCIRVSLGYRRPGDSWSRSTATVPVHYWCLANGAGKIHA